MSNPELKKYADKIRTLAQESSLDEKTPDKYLLGLADAVENNKFQLSAAIETIVNTRKEFFDLQKNVIIDIVELKNNLATIDEALKGIEQNVNATTLFHQNQTDLLIAYFGVPKKNEEQTPPPQVETETEIPEIAEVEVPEIQDSEPEPETPKQVVAETPPISNEEEEEVIPDGVAKFKGKKK